MIKSNLFFKNIFLVSIILMLTILINPNTAYALAVDEATCMEMVFKIPANAGGIATITTDSVDTWEEGVGSYLNLPIPIDTNNNFIVDWGDGTVEQFGSTAHFPTHLYTNTIETDYTVKISGRINSIGNTGHTNITKDNTARIYYSYTNYLTDVNKYGVLNATLYSFGNCRYLKYVGQASEHTFDNINNTSYMFYSCSKLTTIDTTNFDTSRVTSMRDMFCFCSGLTSLDVTGFDTSNTTNMSYLFAFCSSLTSLDVTHFDTSNVTNMGSMFDGCSSLISLDVTHFNTSRVTDMSDMFYNCEGLIAIDVTHFDTSNVTTMNGMFGACTKFTSLDVTNFNTSKVTNFGSMFYDCAGLTTIDVTHFDTSKATNLGSMFCWCSGLTSLDVTHFDTSRVTNMNNMFSSCKKLPAIDVTHFDTSKVVDMGAMFSSCYELTSLDVTHFDTSNVTNMGSLFGYCEKLTSLDVTHFDTSKVTKMSYMFQHTNLPDLDLSNFNTSKVTEMQSMFSGTHYVSIELPNFDTSNVKTMYGMFSGCKELKSINLSNFDVSKVENMCYLFQRCENLEEVIFGDWNLSSLKHTDYTGNENTCRDTYNMFCDCSSIKTIDLSTWNASSLQEIKRMFEGCRNLEYIIINDSFTTLNGSRAFIGCNSLKGIITVSDYSSEDKILTFTDDNNLPNDVIIYVIDSTAETNLEADDDVSLFLEDSRDVGSDLYRVQQLLTLVGEEELDIHSSKVYSASDDEGVLVLGFSNITESDEIPYSILGYNVTTTGLPVTLSPGQSATVTYTLNKGTGATAQTNIASVTRTLTGVLAVDEATCMEMVFKIPANAGGIATVTSSSTTTGNWQQGTGSYLNLPIVSNSVNNFIVDWGDGTVEAFGSTAYFPTHLYTNTEAINYTVKISGRVNEIAGAVGYISKYNVYRDYYTFANYLTNLLKYGELNCTHYSFAQCKNLASVGTATPHTFDNINSTLYMFYYCSKLTSIDTTNFDTSKVTNMKSMFDNCTALTSLDVTHFDTSKVTNMSSMFNSCRGLTSLDVTHFDTSNVTNMSSMFNSCRGLTSLDVTHFDTSNVTNMAGMFSSCSGLTSLDVTHFDTSKVTDMSNMFSYCSGITSLDVTHLDTSKVTSMYCMFSGCSSLTSLDVTHFDTSKVTNMSNMFSTCKGLTSLDVTHFDTSKVANMGLMFSSCESITSLDVTHFDTSKVTDMDWMFSGCKRLTSLDVTNFDTSNVTSMALMFHSCERLTSIDVTNFDTSKVTDMDWMFLDCWNLKSLDLTSFDTSKVTSMQLMFLRCGKLEYILISDRFTKLNGENQFVSCTSLKGIITLNDYSTSDKMLKFSNNNGLKDLSNAIIYVPSATAETNLEANNSAATFLADSRDNGTDLYRVQQIMSLVGSPSKEIPSNIAYTTADDEGVTVLGRSNKTEINSVVYTDLGFSVFTSGLPVTLSKGQEADVTYVLRRTTDSGTTQISTLVRHLTVGEDRFGTIYTTQTDDNGNTLKDILKISKGSKNTINMATHYEGNLIEPYIEITLKNSSGTLVSNTSSVMTIKDSTNTALSYVNSTDSDAHKVYKMNITGDSQSMKATFLSGLSNGRYKINIVLKDKNNRLYATEEIVIDVAN